MAQQNTAFGVGTLSNVISGNYNVAFGYLAGNALTTGQYNTAIGANAFATGSTFNFSTAVGYNAQITGNNQISMGTAAETVLIPGSINMSGDTITNAMVEKYSTGTVTTNAITVAYSALSNIIAISPSSAANIALTITSLPITRGTAIYDFTFIISVGSFKQYINTLNVNGSSVIMRAAGGLANILVNALATVVLQTISIQMNAGTVVNAFTNVASYF